MSRSRLGIGPAVAIAAICSVAFPAGASAATIVVNSDLDTNPAAGFPCTLREAVFVSNTNEPTGGRGVGDLGCGGDSADPDTIILTANHIYTLTQGFAIEDNNVWADLDLAGPTTIRTNGGMATIQGNGTDPQVNERDRVLHVLSSSGGVRLERVKVEGGWVSSGVGGGGILNDGPLTLVDSEVTGNRSEAAGGTLGGGIYTRGPLGTLTISGSTVAGNVAQSVGASPNQAIGGGIAVYGTGSSVSITNSTISGNTARGDPGLSPGFVGGAFLGDGTANTPASSALVNNTITQNTATVGGAASGGLQVATGTMSGNIVAGNVADNDPQDCFGTPTSSGGGNLVGESQLFHCDNLTAPSDLIGTPTTPVLANLGNLLNNGGLTRTHLPNPASPAVNRGGTCPATDQRGLFRYISLPCDSGSVEVGATATPPPPSPPPPPTQLVQPPGPTGQRAAALKKCKKKKGRAKRRCKRNANKLPI